MNKVAFSKTFEKVRVILLKLEEFTDKSIEERKAFKFSKWLLNKIVIGAFAVALTVVTVVSYLDLAFADDVRLAALTLMSFGYLAVIAATLLTTYENGRSIFLFIKAPLDVTYERMQKVADGYASITEELSKFELLDLKRALVIVEDERKAFERRVGVLVGAVQNVGIIPGLITLYLAWVKVVKSDALDFTWIAGVILALYTFAAFCHYLFSRLDFHIATLTLCIEQLEAEKENEKDMHKTASKVL